MLIDRNDVGKNWQGLIEMQGALSETSLLKLNITNDTDNDTDVIVGSVSANPLDPTKLIFNLDADTLPSNTLAAVNRIINPKLNYPGDGSLPAVADGQRYLITESITTDGYPNWGVDANENDIIQYSATTSLWTVVFNSTNHTDVEYITNTYTSKQYKWKDGLWISSYEGIYNPGFWRLVL